MCCFKLRNLSICNKASSRILLTTKPVEPKYQGSRSHKVDFHFDPSSESNKILIIENKKIERRNKWNKNRLNWSKLIIDHQIDSIRSIRIGKHKFVLLTQYYIRLSKCLVLRQLLSAFRVKMEEKKTLFDHCDQTLTERIFKFFMFYMGVINIICVEVISVIIKTEILSGCSLSHFFYKLGWAHLTDQPSFFIFYAFYHFSSSSLNICI